jgi:hypothetical protein
MCDTYTYKKKVKLNKSICQVTYICYIKFMKI